MNIYVLNTLGIGIDLINSLIGQIEIKGIIGLSDREKSDAISDFVYQKEFCKQDNLAFIEMENYNLSTYDDKKKLLDLEIDVLIVSGWQRLIPDWLIEHCKVCAIGSHGSPLGITKGRGRSPQNWALILGLKTFHISIFKIDPGVDSGPIIDTKTFEYTDFDDIKTSYYKICLLTSEMIINSLNDPDFLNQNFIKQNSNDAEYFPQRLPSDGKIDWYRSDIEIYNFIRALTRPYPGAESYINGVRVIIWDAIPFNLNFSDKYKTGEVIKIFNKNDILVKTIDSSILIVDYEFDCRNFIIKEGMIFESEPFSQQIDRIIIRHEKKLPNLPVSKIILDQRTKKNSSQ